MNTVLSDKRQHSKAHSDDQRFHIIFLPVDEAAEQIMAGIPQCRDSLSCFMCQPYFGRPWLSRMILVERPPFTCTSRSAGFQTCCIADFQVGRHQTLHQQRVWKPVTPETARKRVV